MEFTIGNIRPDSTGFQTLKSESIASGFNMLSRLEDNWLTNKNRFDKPGEKLLGVLSEGLLVGVCGLNRDPFMINARAGRIRHLYISNQWRRMQAGSLLLSEVVKDSALWFDFLNTNAPPSAFIFYQRAGFIPFTGSAKVTHRLPLTST
ncbi:ribosomal protein S18 acetylase RimI-like enzyme [Erwinia toletana]|uniref:Ribosomal protein S18 acetylase RimI-like enzyme n=1 Tax=Winslowiella toletana TaxID=92490 RepID=A0ABS4PDU7_9GAMM|nr:GNAT family N-acetyltransferase [Winslowiella toletana]MBP2170804.1 ribosomal protein S18 acetylase RimI-like enzyme [Winslowiella toletana]